jgi:hypothetical protein
MNLSTSSIPGYGSDLSYDSNNQKEVLPLDILRQSQIWRCSTFHLIQNQKVTQLENNHSNI